MDRDLVELLRFGRRTESHTDLIACSLCLRVLRASERIEQQVIREISSYELESPPRLHPGVCDLCAESILDRRAQTEAVAA
jgi:hypothetical protein